jgi:hypothetical protein
LAVCRKVISKEAASSVMQGEKTVRSKPLLGIYWYRHTI